MVARNREFRSDHYLHDDDGVQQSTVIGPVSFLNPTRAEIQEPGRSVDDLLLTAPYPLLQWTSRNNRKGRHQLLLTTPPQDLVQLPDPTNGSRAILKGLWKMVTRFPVWDVSYDVAASFTLGSAIWVLAAVFIFHPVAAPESAFENETLYAGRIIAFVGATFFFIGSVLMVLEAMNEDRTGCFGWALKRALEIDDRDVHVHSWKIVPDRDSCTHSHANKDAWLAPASGGEHGKGNGLGSSDEHLELPEYPQAHQRPWIWLPTIHHLRKHYVFELGFLASVIQMLASTIFYISSFTGLPVIFTSLTVRLIYGVRFVPQFIGGAGFVVAAALFTVETQSKWYRPAFRVLGWHVGVWDLAGGIGFTLSPVFGVMPATWAQYQSALSTLWGSAAFFIGSSIQLYESLEKYPVEKK
ncbi:MAG: hypothetical protein M1831_005573 [Alyxoria varia]|nr:MAG: hypothetical protein M1831_005573 [Alyxoria varia]